MQPLLSRFVTAAALVAAAALASPPSAAASIAHPGVVDENPADFTPDVLDDGLAGHSAVYSLAQLGSTLYAGGKFRTVAAVNGTQYQRQNIMGFSATSGAMTSFAPNINGDVWAIEPSGSALYIGGTFTSVNGVARRGIAKVNATTGTIDTAFNASLKSGRVTEIRLVNGRLIIGGTFPGQLAALNPLTGADTGYIGFSISGKVASNSGPTKVYRFAVNPAGTRLVAVGNFDSVGGQPRQRVFMANLGPAAATVSDWYYQPFDNMCAANSLPAYMRDVDFSPDGSYFVVDSTGFVPKTGGIGRDICDAAARFETANLAPLRPTWINYTGGDTLHSVAVTGSVVYVQGHQRWVDNPYGRDNPGPGAQARQGIAALDPLTGKALSWNPGKTRAVGGKDLLATSAGLWVGSDGRRFNGKIRDNLAFLPLP